MRIQAIKNNTAITHHHQPLTKPIKATGSTTVPYNKATVRYRRLPRLLKKIPVAI